MVNEIKPSVERVVAKSAEKKAWRKPAFNAVALSTTAGAAGDGGDQDTFS